MGSTRTSLLISTLILLISVFELLAQSTSHPHLYFDQAGMDALRNRALNNPRLNKIWLKFKKERVDAIDMKITVTDGTFSENEGRDYGDALTDLAMAYIVLRQDTYFNKAKEIILKLADRTGWGTQLAIAHISIGVATCWDIMYDRFSASERSKIRDAVLRNANNHFNSNQLSNHNWTPAAAEGLIGLAFGNNEFLTAAKQNFKEGDRSVLWALGSDGFCPQGLGYWRKYTHIGLFFKALRFNEPQNDWFHLGKEYPGSEHLEKSSYPRIYGNVPHSDVSCVVVGDSHVAGPTKKGHYGNMGALTLAASEYNDGYVLDFMDYLINDISYHFDGEDAAIFLLYDDGGIPHRSYRDLPLSSYWPNMEGAIFRSSWDDNAIVFFMRCGSPAGHARKIKGLPPDQHNHPDANGFVLFYNKDYLAAEDGGEPRIGPDAGVKITYGHNTLLIDGVGQRGDKSTRVDATTANMDFLDADHVGYLLGDATDAYKDLNRFYRYVIYRKHKYFIVVDELKDDLSHKYEFLLGTDKLHTISSAADNKFQIKPTTGAAKLPVVFVEPRDLRSSIKKDRPYIFGDVMVDMLRVWPNQNARNATFFSLHYPRKSGESDPGYTKIYDGGRSGILVDGDEYHLYNDSGTRYTYRSIATDAKLCYFKDNPNAFEYLAAGSTEFKYNGQIGITSSKPLVAAFKGVSGKIRLGKNLGTDGEASITLFYPGITGVLVDGQTKSLVGSGSGSVTFKLSPKRYKIGPSGYEQTVTDNYDIEILAGGSPTFVNVARPNGGENWVVASNQSIEWTSSGSFSNVKIEYSTNSGSNWQVITSSTTNDGQFSWTIPTTPSDNALVRISDASDGSPSDVSDNAFSITGGGTPSTPVISFFNPTSGPVGTVATITGSNFSGATSVTFNGASASFSIITDNEIRATVPTGATTGKIKVTNSAGTGTSASNFVVTASGGGGTQSFTPTDDAFVWSANPSNNYGSSSDLRVRKSSANQIAYFKFSITGLSGSVVSARLRLKCNDGSNDGGGVYLVSNNFLNSSNPWIEGGLIWTNAPTVSGSALSSAGSVSVGQTVEWDVTTAVTANGVYSFAIKNGSSDAVYYSSKEGTQAPQLVITTSSTSIAKVMDEEFDEIESIVENPIIPEALTLLPNYPNPFNPETTIQYGLPAAEEVRLVIYNIRGEEVRILVNEYQSAGFKTVRWDGRNHSGQSVSSGLYVARLIAIGMAVERKLLLQK